MISSHIDVITYIPAEISVNSLRTSDTYMRQ